jgi:iron(III) transport system substrate-binding protein
MRSLRLTSAAAVAALAAACALPVRAAQPPATSSRLTAAAEREGRVVVYSATDRDVVAPLLADFAALHPAIAVEYHELHSGELYERFKREADAGHVAADVLWSPAMDLQIKLANDGYAAPYESPEAAGLPSWAVWRNEAFGTTLEPFVFVHDEGTLPSAETPGSHADLLRVLEAEPARLQGRVATYDPARSSLGYLLLTQDSRIDPRFADTLLAYGRARTRLHATTSGMLDDLRSGRALLAFNVIGSYALRARQSRPSLRIVFPRDYVLAMSRIALVAKGAPHPSAARVFLDYLLSARGQELLASRCSLFSIRNDVAGENTAVALSRSLGARLKPIHLGPSLLVYLDPSKREGFLTRWRATFAQPDGSRERRGARESGATGSRP